MSFNFGNYTIDSQKLFEALKSAGITQEADLKRLDTNGDMKITVSEVKSVEDDLVSLADDFDSEESDNDTELSQEQMQQLQSLESSNMQLESQMIQIYSLLASSSTSAEDAKTYQEQAKSIQGQIDSNRKQILNILTQAENKALAAQGANATNPATGSQYLTTGGGINGGSKLGDSVVNIAQSYVGKLKESDGSYLKVTGGRQEHWCADFVTYVVNQACQQTGTSLNGFGSPSVANLRAWGEANNCYTNLNSMNAQQKAEWIVKNLQPGDVMIMQNNSSHTGVVTKVYPDGSFDTVEGNTSDQCLQRHYSANEARLSGFIDIT